LPEQSRELLVERFDPNTAVQTNVRHELFLDRPIAAVDLWM
jgi:hypothetical protein